MDKRTFDFGVKELPKLAKLRDGVELDKLYLLKPTFKTLMFADFLQDFYYADIEDCTPSEAEAQEALDHAIDGLHVSETYLVERIMDLMIEDEYLQQEIYSSLTEAIRTVVEDLDDEVPDFALADGRN
jgi:hypothetical protein